MLSLYPKSDFSPAPLKNLLRLMLMMPIFVSGMICGLQDLKAQTAQEQGMQQAKPSEEGDLDRETGKYRTTDILYPESEQSRTQAGDANQSEAIDAIPVPIEPMDDTRTLGGQTFVDDVFSRPQNRWGFALSAYQAYTNDISAENQPQRSSGITALMPRFFFNIGKRSSQFHIDLGAGYRRYNQRRESNAWDYQGSSLYSLQLSKRASFTIADQFTSSFNDAWSFLSLSSPLDYDPLSSNEVLFNRQRISRNSIRATLIDQITSKAGFQIFGGHRLYQYQKNTLNNSQALEFGGSFNYQIVKWLHVASSATAYINLVEGAQSDARIYHVQFGGLDFRLANAWKVWAGGGIDISDFEDENRTLEHVNAGIEYTRKKASLSLTYQRGFTSALGISRLLMSDVVSANFGYRITNWLNASLQSYYYNSSEAGRGGHLKTLSGGGGLEFGLRRDLIVTTNVFYQNQRTSSFSVEGLGLNRLTGYIGLQYIWPARRYE